MPRRMNTIVAGMVAFFLVTVIPGCWGHRCIEFGSDFECIERPEDNTGYLQPICVYISNHYDCYPQDPNILEIMQVVSGAEQDSFYLPQYSTFEYDFVKISCCHLGDWAILRIETKTVEFFISGDY